MRSYIFLLAAVMGLSHECAAFLSSGVLLFAPIASQSPLQQMPWTLPVGVQGRSSPVVLRPMARASSSSLTMAKGEEEDRAMANMARAARKVGPNDRVVELRKPIGLVLEEDERGNVYIVEVLPGSNASRNKKVNVGDKIAFVSATFGDEVWSAKGVGLSRVRSAIKLRQGPLVKLVLETTKEGQKKMERDSAKLKQQQEAKESEAEKKDRLLRELQEDTKVQKKKPWYGLF